jgi:prolyl oligopeptidase
MTIMSQILLLALLVLTAAFAIAACSQKIDSTGSGGGPGLPVSYPETRRVEHVDTYNDVEVADPYRWLEDLEGKETADWVAAQNAVTEPFLERIPQRERIENRLTELWNYERFSVPVKEGGRYFYERNDGLQDQDVLYVADSLGAEARVLIDPNTFSEDRTTSLGEFAVSPDGKLIAYSTSEGGSDWRTYRIRDVGTGKDLEDVLDAIKFTTAQWTPDNRGFYYSRYPRDENGEGDGSKQVSIHYHVVGAKQAEDAHVYSIIDHPTRNPHGSVTDDGRFLVIYVFDGYESNGIYYKELNRPDAKVVRLLDDWDALYDFLGNQGRVFYFSTNNDAPRSRVIAIDLDDPAPDRWREIVPEAKETLEAASLIGGHVVARYLKDASSLAKVFATDGSLAREVELPDVGTVGGFKGKVEDPETFFSYTSFTAPSRIYRYDVSTGERTVFRESRVDADLEGFTSRQVFYESKDGTRVPMFIIHKKGIEPNGDNPTMLYGYGGFNVSLTPYYSTSRLVWMEMGGVMAIPNLRGGGEYGEAWHLAGTKLNKQNVFDDFIAAAEWLIDNGYTSKKKLAIAGGSNGGLLVGATMNQRPDLFGATLPSVGVLDMLRYHTASANARQWSSDYGLSDNEEEFRALHAYSPYHNIGDGACYPPTLISTADHDDRVVPWHSFKFAAAMQKAQGCPSPILIRVETRAGHGAGKPTWMRIEEIANEWAFLVWALQMKV